MKITMPMLKELGVCDEAYACVGGWWAQYGFTEMDYDKAIEILLSNRTYGEQWLAQNAHSQAHGDFEGWADWFLKLKERPEAIMYFGDHIEENLFVTTDGLMHESLESALAHRKRVYQEIRDDHATKRVINGIKINQNGSETWQSIDINTVNVNDFDEFAWHDSKTGLNNRTTSPSIALAFDAQQAKILEAINEAEKNSVIRRKITDSSGKYSVWIDVA